MSNLARDAATIPTTHYVDWGAIILGSVLASAIATVLITFGTGIGLSMISPYAGEGVSKTVYFASLGLWTVWVVLCSCSAGGYLAGRLRRRVGDASEHEVEVRDGAHGLGVWGVSVVVASLLMAAGVSGMLGSASKIAGSAATAAARSDDANASTLDALFRDDSSPAETSIANSGSPTEEAGAPHRRRDLKSDREEIGRLLARDTLRGELDAKSKEHVARLVAVHTGMTQAEAERRVTEVLEDAKRKAEAARKLGILIAFATAVALLVGGAAAAWASTLGGKHRDENTDLSTFWRWTH